ncbi:MAG: hypothetical protein JWM08_1714 [Candidatus Angelobacter sp.]|nr:hypothetical protein [Candidatus Angelobacter sp.]
MPKQSQKPLAAKCSSCGGILKDIDYKMWGSKKFDPGSGLYMEDEAIGKSDIEFSCPNCSAELDPEGFLF